MKAGDHIERLTLLRSCRITRKNGYGWRTRPAWECMCDCGNLTTVEQAAITYGATKSCGCLQKEKARLSTIRPGMYGKTHGYTNTPTYRSWNAMNTRCKNPNTDNFKHYGGRGIQVCDRWNNFENFLNDMGERPDGKTLDRIDVNGNYKPENCRWATYSQQSRNKQAKRITEFSFGDLADELTKRIKQHNPESELLVTI